MPKLTLYVAPHTCSIVPTIALEEIGAAFETRLVRLSKQEQKSSEFLKLNPKGKVPMLLIDGAPLTENAAIVNWLNKSYPEGRLMPDSNEVLQSHQHLSDLIFFSSTVHPAVTRFAMPFRFVEDKELAFSEVRPKSQEALEELFGIIDQRLHDGPWWYGEKWSIVDAYLLWTWTRSTLIGFPQDAFPRIKQHHDESLRRPAIQRALSRQAADIEILKSEGLYNAPA